MRMYAKKLTICPDDDVLLSSGLGMNLILSSLFQINTKPNPLKIPRNSSASLAWYNDTTNRLIKMPTTKLEPTLLLLSDRISLPFDKSLHTHIHQKRLWSLSERNRFGDCMRQKRNCHRAVRLCGTEWRYSFLDPATKLCSFREGEKVLRLPSFPLNHQMIGKISL